MRTIKIHRKVQLFEHLKSFCGQYDHHFKTTAAELFNAARYKDLILRWLFLSTIYKPELAAYCWSDVEVIFLEYFDPTNNYDEDDPDHYLNQPGNDEFSRPDLWIPQIQEEDWGPLKEELLDQELLEAPTALKLCHTDFHIAEPEDEGEQYAHSLMKQVLLLNVEPVKQLSLFVEKGDPVTHVIDVARRKVFDEHRVFKVRCFKPKEGPGPVVYYHGDIRYLEVEQDETLEGTYTLDIHIPQETDIRVQTPLLNTHIHEYSYPNNDAQ